MVLELVANQSVGNDLEVRILHTAFADEWNGIPRKSHDLEIVGSTPASAISEFHGSQINIFFGLPHPESKYKNRGYAIIAQLVEQLQILRW